MKSVLLAISTLILFFSCNSKKENSKYEIYNFIGDKKFEILSEDDNQIRSAHFLSYNKIKVDENLYNELPKFRYKLIESIEVNKKIDTLLFSNLQNAKDYLPDYRCPGFFKYIVLYKKNDTLKYICKFSDACDEYFIYDIKNKTAKYKKLNFKKTFKKNDG